MNSHKKLHWSTAATAPSLVFVSPAAWPADWTIDESHTSLAFSVRHLMVSDVRGSFGKVTGSAVYDPAKPEATQFEALIDISSINTNNAKRDEHLRGVDFFDTAKHPTATFKAKGLEKAGKGFALNGTLTLHGVSRPVKIEIPKIEKEIKDPWGQIRMGASGSAEINRKEFGITWNKALDSGGLMIGEKVRLQIDLELVKKQAP